MTDPDIPAFPFVSFVNRCQGAIGVLVRSQATDLGPVWRLFSRPPVTNTEGQRLMTVAFVADVLTRLRAEKRITRVPAWGELRVLFSGASDEAVSKRMSALRLLEIQGPRRGRPGCPNLADQALQALSELYGDPNQSLTAVAQRLNVTAGHLGRILRRHTGHPFRWHLRGVRMRQASTLLHGRAAVKDIAMSVGYPSVSEFDRHFRATFGMTPSAYRMAAAAPPGSASAAGFAPSDHGAHDDRQAVVGR